MSEIPKGFCQCGCGGKTLIAKETSTRRGYRKGEPMNFIWGHNRRGRKNEGVALRKGCLNHSWKGGRGIHANGHPLVYAPDHPRAHRGQAFEHILRAEKALGKYLPTNAKVHHHTPEQLVICQDQGYHLLLHQRQRAYEACGHANWRKCVFCKTYDDPANLTYSKQGKPYHRQCNREYQKQNRRNHANQVSENR